MRFLLALILASIILFPSVSYARDMRCFTEKECIAARTELLSDDEAKKNPLYQGSDAAQACGGKENKDKEKIGFCYPAAQADTQISFAGRRTFSGIGDFLQLIYRLAVVSASIIAVIMIIIAGFQWTTSGGSPEAIKSAQKRIQGSLIGLILAVLSYFILYTINPYLVNFRLPQAWIINDIPLGVEYCKDLEGIGEEKFSYIGKQNTQVASNAYENATFDIDYKENDKKILEQKFSCGDQLLSKSGNGNICRGHFCPQNGGFIQTCVKIENKYECKQGQIIGEISNPKNLSLNWFSEGWEENADALDDFETYVVCSDGEKKRIDKDEILSIQKGKGLYQVFLETKTISETKNKCDTEALGLIIFPDIEENWDIVDEGHYLGINPEKPHEAVDLGDKNSLIFQAIKSKIEYKKGVPASAYLIPLDAVEKGYNLNINLGEIVDID